jgi:predicted N-acetyltransferase YhbS
MRPEDVDAADLVAWAAIQAGIPAEFVPDESVRAARAQRRIAHVLSTDPEGAWVAEDGDGRVAGVALALVREGVWGLSLLAVAPSDHGGGLGGRLLRAALRTAEGTRGGIIVSSQHPAAMRSYARAGFELRPCVTLAGVVDRSTIPAGLRSRPGDPEADRATIDRASRHVRGASHGDDVATMLENGFQLLVLPDHGFAVIRDGSVALLAATDDDAARDLLWSSWAHGVRGASVHVDFLTAGQDWAVRAGLEAGLALSAEGPVFTRGALGALRPFIPSGAYL